LCAVQDSNRLASGRRRRPLDRRESVFVRGKSLCILLRHDLVADPHGELAPTALYYFGVDPKFVLDERGHTDRAGTIVSDFAVSDADVFHGRRS
jgi:hypothetical protein